MITLFSLFSDSFQCLTCQCLILVKPSTKIVCSTLFSIDKMTQGNIISCKAEWFGVHENTSGHILARLWLWIQTIAAVLLHWEKIPKSKAYLGASLTYVQLYYFLIYGSARDWIFLNEMGRILVDRWFLIDEERLFCLDDRLILLTIHQSIFFLSTFIFNWHQFYQIKVHF